MTGKHFERLWIRLVMLVPCVATGIGCEGSRTGLLVSRDGAVFVGAGSPTFAGFDRILPTQRRLFDAVSKVADPHVNMTGKVNMDSLWELFFDSGFIYPDKYGIISQYTKKLKETYRKLYEEGQYIFTHLTYQDQGQVYGHMSMVKAYEDSWIIHHLAARPMGGGTYRPQDPHSFC